MNAAEKIAGTLDPAAALALIEAEPVEGELRVNPHLPSAILNRLRRAGAIRPESGVVTEDGQAARTLLTPVPEVTVPLREPDAGYETDVPVSREAEWRTPEVLVEGFQDVLVRALWWPDREPVIQTMQWGKTVEFARELANALLSAERWLSQQEVSRG